MGHMARIERKLAGRIVAAAINILIEFPSLDAVVGKLGVGKVRED
jgi:hypothetical protein